MNYAELAAAALGACSALFLALPLLHEIRVSKRFIRLLAQMDRDQDSITLRQLRDQFLNEKMTAYARFETYAFLGFVLLFASFLISVLVTVERLRG